MIFAVFDTSPLTMCINCGSLGDRFENGSPCAVGPLSVLSYLSVCTVLPCL